MTGLLSPERTRVPTAPGRLPGLGHLWSLLRRPIPFLTEASALGPVVRMYFWRKPVYYLTTPEAVHQLLVTEAKHFEKGFVFDKARALLGNGLFTSEGAFHLSQRRLVQPAFAKEPGRAYGLMSGQHAERTVPDWPAGELLDVSPRLHELTQDIALEALFSTRLDERARQRVHAALPVVLEGFIVRALYPAEFVERLPLRINREFDRAVADLHEVVEHFVAECTRNPLPEGSLLSVLGAGGGGCPVQVRDEAVSMLLAGTETAATTLAWALWQLAEHPELQERVRAELAGAQDNWHVAGEFPLTTAVLNETMRLHTPNWLLMRRATGPVVLDGVALPAGAEIVFSPTVLHRTADCYPDPMTFNPARWTGQIPRKAFIPFGGGVRKCVGDSFAEAEMRAVLASVLGRWRVLPGRAPVPDASTATLQPKGLRVVLAPV
ncbi:pentalenene oxygenase [Crossiella equi]|uniref:Pentalenene oxygenase n=1 Tax=Crossiella equi TaxID=130796 RepID=A0ABS5AQU5_9PSEU|nr:cytochrome P450 [Crossiella equi]MBP2478931.1 pentalenene oxygenase [Crossiella equi]